MNKLIIGENIYRLRKLRKITQEQLGQYIGVSKGAISKWESGVSYPDIELLPVLARFFDISIDELLNFDSKISEELEEEILSECSSEINDGDSEKGIELCKSYIRKYTNNYELKLKLVALMTIGCAFIKDEDKLKRAYGKILNIHEEIIENATDEETIEKSVVAASGIYGMFEEYEKALGLLNKIKKSIYNVDLNKAHIYILMGNECEVEKGRKLLKDGLLQSLGEIQSSLQGIAKSYYKEDLLLARKYTELAMKIDDFSEEALPYGKLTNLMTLSEHYAYHKDVDGCLDLIREAIDEVKLKSEEINKPWYLNDEEYKNLQFVYKSTVNAMTTFLDSKEYNFLDDNKEFIELRKKVRNIRVK